MPWPSGSRRTRARRARERAESSPGGRTLTARPRASPRRPRLPSPRPSAKAPAAAAARRAGGSSATAAVRRNRRRRALFEIDLLTGRRPLDSIRPGISSGEPMRNRPRWAGSRSRCASASGAVVLGLTACTVSGPSVSRVSAPNEPYAHRIARNGLYYALPRTWVRVRVPVVRTQDTLTPLGQAVVDMELAAFERLLPEAPPSPAEPSKAPNAAPLKDSATSPQRQKLARSFEARLHPKNAPETAAPTAPLSPALARRVVLREHAANVARAEEGLQDPTTRDQLDADQRFLLEDPDAQDMVWSISNLGVDLADVEEKVSFELGKDVAVETFADADGDHVFFMEFSGGALTDQSVKIALTELGLLTEI